MRRSVCDTSCWKGPAKLSTRKHKHARSKLTLESKLYGIELDRHDGGVRGRRYAGLVIVVIGDARLRGAAHATEACSRRKARVRSAGTDRGNLHGLRVFERGVGGGEGSRGGLKGTLVVSLADDESGIAAEQPRRHNV